MGGRTANLDQALQKYQSFTKKILTCLKPSSVTIAMRPKTYFYINSDFT